MIIFNILFSENHGLITTLSPLNTLYCWKNAALCKTDVLAKINILTKKLTKLLFYSSMLLGGGGDLILRLINHATEKASS